MNDGKRFELNIKNSMPDNTYHQRIKDQSFDHTSTLMRFTQSNPYDFFVFFDGKLFLLELKSTKSKSFSVQTNKDEKGKMIKLHQIESLSYAEQFNNVHPAFLFNFRLDQDYCFYMPIGIFEDIMFKNGKKSINFDEIKMHSLAVESKKLKINYRYNLEKLFKTIPYDCVNK